MTTSKRTPRGELLPLARAASLLGLTYQQAYARALRGELGQLHYLGVRLFLEKAAVRRARRLPQTTLPAAKQPRNPFGEIQALAGRARAS